MTEKPKNYHQETDIVQFLFGTRAETGTLISSFASSYHRQQGRFYICSKVIGFYSNVLGFEKKLCIHISSLISASLLRNTSIVIQCHSEQHCDVNSSNISSISLVEKHVFRSFKNRLVVLDCIAKVYFECTGENLSLYYKDDEEKEQNPPPPLLHHEQHHESLLPSEEEEEDDDDDNTTDNTTTDDKGRQDDNTADNESEQPTRTTHTYPSIHLDQVALPPTQFNISLKEYHSRFLADDAPKSMTWFQSHCIGDEIQKSTKWKRRKDTMDAGYTRIIHSIHKRTQRLGPSKVSIQRKHSLKWDKSNSIILETVMILGGVPYSDCFVVEDEWVITSIQESCVEVAVRYRVHFLKKTMMKNIIIKQTREEIKKWFDAYLNMLQNELGERRYIKQFEDERKILGLSSSGIWNVSTILIGIFGFILLLLLSCLLYKVNRLETEMRRLNQCHTDTIQSLHVLQDRIQQSTLHDADTNSVRQNVCSMNHPFDSVEL